MLLQVKVRPVGDALDLSEAGKREVVLDIHCPLGVVREFLLRVLANPEVLVSHSKGQPPVEAVLDPAVVPLLVGARHDEVLHLHLLELAVAEDEVPWRDLVAEGAADLGDAERQLPPGCRENVLEIHEHALRGLGTQVHHGCFVLDGADEGLEHEVKHAGLGQLAAAFGAVALPLIVDGYVVGPPAALAVLAVAHGVGESGDVAAGLPDAGVHDDGGLDADDVVAELDQGAPPVALDVVLELDAEGAVVPEPAEAAVDLGGLEDEAAALAEGDERIHVWLGHAV